MQILLVNNDPPADNFFENALAILLTLALLYLLYLLATSVAALILKTIVLGISPSIAPFIVLAIGFVLLFTLHYCWVNASNEVSLPSNFRAVITNGEETRRTSSDLLGQPTNKATTQDTSPQIVTPGDSATPTPS